MIGGNLSDTTTESLTLISDSMLSVVKARIGVLTQPHNPWVEEFNYDAIKHWAWGIGDDNPLWLDRTYASASPHGGIVAPPTMLYAADHGPLGPRPGKSRGFGLPGIHGLHSEDKWTFDRPVPIGTRVSATQCLESLDEKIGGDGRMSLLQIRATEYFDEHGARLATLKRITVRRHRDRSRASRFGDVKPWVYRDDEIEQIHDDYEREPRQGANPRYVDDVQVGDDLGYVVKGPITLMTLISFWMGWGCTFGMTDRIAYEYMRDHPGAVVIDPDTNVRDFPERAHWDALSRTIGLPLGYDLGAQRISWFGHLLTNWAGDHGFPTALSVRLLRPNWMGDTTWIRGKVASVDLHDDHGIVGVDLEATNQRGDVHARGTGAVRLPRAPVGD